MRVRRLLNVFVLFRDGYLMIKFLHANASDMEMTHLLARLFDGFVALKQQNCGQLRRRHWDPISGVGPIDQRRA